MEKSTRVHGLMKLTRYLSLFGEDEPLNFIQNDDADLEKRAREKNTYKASKDSVLSPPPTTSYVEFYN